MPGLELSPSRRNDAVTHRCDPGSLSAALLLKTAGDPAENTYIHCRKPLNSTCAYLASVRSVLLPASVGVPAVPLAQNDQHGVGCWETGLRPTHEK